jgi:hypothetical protein
MLLIPTVLGLRSSFPPLQNAQEQQQYDQRPQQRRAENKIAKSYWKTIWDSTLDDPIALYTLVLALFTTVIGTVALVQLGFIVRADETARISANAAREAANIAKDALLIPQRAYVCAREYRALKISDDAGNTIAWKFTLLVENTGNTPALDTSGGIVLMEVPRDGIHRLGPFAPTQPSLLTKSVVGPRATLVCGGAYEKGRLSGEQVANIMTEKIDVFLCGYVTYRDIFPDTAVRRTLVCVRLVVEDPSFKAPNPFGYHAHQHYNEVT